MSIYTYEFEKKFSEINLDEYFNFIEQHRLLKAIKYQTSNHHILPKWSFPEFSNFTKYSWNKAILTHENHRRAHILLAQLWPRFENTNTVVRMTQNTDSLEYQSILEKNSYFIGVRNSILNKERVENGTHNFLTEEHRTIVRENSISRLENGTHPFSPEVIMEKYGVSNIMKLESIKTLAQSKKEETLHERYGVKHNWEIPGAVKAAEHKKLKTMRDRYGVDYILQLPENRENQSLKMTARNPMKSDESVMKYKNTMYEKYGVLSPLKNSEICKKAVETRKRNELLRPKLVWLKHVTLKQSTRVRKGSEEEKTLLSKGFVYGRGITGFSKVDIELLR